jgi:formimidoylglutamate deiminase
MAQRQIIEADLTWNETARRFERGIRIAVEDGGIAAVGTLNEQPTRRLQDRALLPGFVNVHSHAFQRGLRGLGETFPKGAGDFWTWREAMYRLVESLDETKAYQLSRQCFEEMLAAGVTTVGEFHYIHHAKGFDENFALDEAVLRAARDAGIRISLIQTFYKTGGIGRPLAGGQRQFSTQSIDGFWRQFDHLSTGMDRSTQSMAVAAHSIRAVPLEDVKSLHEESLRRGLPFHMHVEEQPLEIEECVQHYGKTPMALINEHLDINPMFTAVHCTHTAAADMEEYLSRGGGVCINPLTEGNLGDGVPALARVFKHDGRIALGSDSNARVCWTEEMRWLEYGQRLATLTRGHCVDDHGSVASRLLVIATVNGARSLGIKAGRIAPKHHADFVAIDLTALCLRGWTDQTLLDSLIFGTGNEAIAEVCVAGTWRAAGSASLTADSLQPTADNR